MIFPGDISQWRTLDARIALCESMHFPAASNKLVRDGAPTIDISLNGSEIASIVLQDASRGVRDTVGDRCHIKRAS